MASSLLRALPLLALLALAGCPVGPRGADATFFFSAGVAGTSTGTLYLREAPQMRFSATGVPLTSGLYRATPAGIGSQAGSAWIDISPSGPELFSALEVDPFRADRVFAAGLTLPDSFAFRSDDRGGTWTRLTAGLPGPANDRLIAFLRPDPLVLDRLWLGYEQGAGAGGPALFRSDDGGQTWAAQAAYPAGSALEIAFHPTDPLTRLVRSDRAVSRTTDGGATWVTDGQGLPTGQLRALTASAGAPDVYYLILSPGGHVYRRDPGPGGWTELPAVQSLTAAPTPLSGLELVEAVLLAVDPQAPQRLYLGVGRYGVFVSEDGGQTFAHRISGTRGVLYHHLTPYQFLIEPGGRVIMATHDALYASDDQGRSWVLMEHRGLPAGRYSYL